MSNYYTRISTEFHWVTKEQFEWFRRLLHYIEEDETLNAKDPGLDEDMQRILRDACVEIGYGTDIDCLWDPHLDTMSLWDASGEVSVDGVSAILQVFARKFWPNNKKTFAFTAIHYSDNHSRPVRAVMVVVSAQGVRGIACDAIKDMLRRVS
jgi:hypothetical protein